MILLLVQGGCSFKAMFIFKFFIYAHYEGRKESPKMILIGTDKEESWALRSFF